MPKIDHFLILHDKDIKKRSYVGIFVDDRNRKILAKTLLSWALLRWKTTVYGKCLWVRMFVQDVSGADPRHLQIGVDSLDSIPDFQKCFFLMSLHSLSEASIQRRASIGKFVRSPRTDPLGSQIVNFWLSEQCIFRTT